MPVVKLHHVYKGLGAGFKQTALIIFPLLYSWATSASAHPVKAQARWIKIF
jgi:hypothetical protein